MHGSHCCEGDRTTGMEATCSDGEIKLKKVQQNCSQGTSSVLARKQNT